MLKRIITILLTVIAIVSTAIPAYAINIANPCYLYTSSASSTLTISSKTANCESFLNGYRSTTTKIKATQYLEKKNGSNWNTVSGGTWSDTQNGSSFSMCNSMSNLESGTYRLKTVFTVYSGTKSETVSKTSKEVKL